MTLNDRIFAIAQAGYIGIVWLALLLLPGAEIWSTLLSMIGVWVITSAIYQSTPWRHTTGWWTLLFATTILAVGVIANVHYFTTVSGGTTQLPVLNNPDSAEYYHDALYSFGHEAGHPTSGKQHGYGLLISWLWSISGISIVPPLIVNMLLILVCIILSGGISYRLLRGETKYSGKWVASCAMVMTSAVCYFLNSGTLLLKDATICFAMALIGISLTILRQPASTKRRQTKYLLMFTFGVTLLAFTRYFYILMVVAGILLMLKHRKKEYFIALFMLTVCIIAWCSSGIAMAQYDFNAAQYAMRVIDGSTISDSYFFDEPQHRAYNTMVEGYLDYPWWRKIMYLPMSAVVQYLIPFPWNFGMYSEYGYTLAYARIAYPWYVVGYCIIYFIIIAWRKAPATLFRMILWAFLMWLVPAYICAGTVSRYTLPLLPMLIPAAVYVIASKRNNKSFKVCGAIYSILIIAILIVAYNIQQSGMQ